MKHINKLNEALASHFNWNKARISFLSQMIQSLIKLRTSSLSELSEGFCTCVKTASSYKRIQRFFKDFQFDQTSIIPFILRIFCCEHQKLVLIMDRTIWYFGKTHVNVLVISFAYKGISIPLVWKTLKGAGNSTTKERITLTRKVIRAIGKKRIDYLVADREFVGNIWFNYLIESKIRFVIRIKHDTWINREEIYNYPIPVREVFKELRLHQKKIPEKEFNWKGQKVYLAASRSNQGLLIVMTNCFDANILKMYRKRWEIETLFGCFKTKGFCLESTHMTKHRRIEKLFFILTLAFCWCYKIGEKQFPTQKLPRKQTHGRPVKSLFRWGLESLRKIFLHISLWERDFYHALNVLTCSKPGNCLCV